VFKGRLRCERKAQERLKTLSGEKAVDLVSLNKNSAYHSSRPSLTSVSLFPPIPFFYVAWVTGSLVPRAGQNLDGNSGRVVLLVRRLSAISSQPVDAPMKR
jgi:hypothetical protein